MRSSLSRILLSVLLMGSFAGGPVFVPLVADAENSAELKQVVRKVKRAYGKDYIEKDTYNELMDILKEARAAPDASAEYYEAVANFRLLVSSQTGVTISKKAASRIFTAATEL